MGGERILVRLVSSLTSLDSTVSLHSSMSTSLVKSYLFKLETSHTAILPLSVGLLWISSEKENRILEKKAITTEEISIRSFEFIPKFYRIRLESHSNLKLKLKIPT